MNLLGLMHTRGWRPYERKAGLAYLYFEEEKVFQEFEEDSSFLDPMAMLYLSIYGF